MSVLVGTTSNAMASFVRCTEEEHEGEHEEGEDHDDKEHQDEHGEEFELEPFTYSDCLSARYYQPTAQ